MAERSAAGTARLEAALAGLEILDLAGLRTRWQELRGRPAPATFRAELLRAALAYTLQERALGGLKPATLRLLRSVAANADHPDRKRGRGGSAPHKGQTASAEADASNHGQDSAAMAGARASPAKRVRQEPTRIKPGTKLLRTWQGVTHEVLVCDTGVVYRGKQHRSLSEVARLITGQRWSGPLFFGLRSPAVLVGNAVAREARSSAAANRRPVR